MNSRQKLSVPIVPHRGAVQRQWSAECGRSVGTPIVRGSQLRGAPPAPQLVNSSADLPRLPGRNLPPARRLYYAAVHLLHATP